MLSRRNVRIKVMQLLFAQGRDEELKFETVKTKYWETISSTYQLYLFCFYNLIEIVKLAKIDHEKRKTKHLPTEADKVFTPKLFENPLIQSISTNQKLNKVFEKYKFSELTNNEYLSKIYNDFLKEENYLSYISNRESSHVEDLEILLELFRFCRKNELFNEILEDNYHCWLDDKSVVIGAVKKSLKALPNDKSEFFEDFIPDDETVREFGEQLLDETHSNDAKLLSIIQPILQNWEHDRLAVLDLLLIKMAMSEFMYFETIPTKVTLNEYVELAKDYSTAKSKEFINGVLDKVLKQINDQGKVKKSGRGLIG